MMYNPLMFKGSFLFIVISTMNC